MRILLGCLTTVILAMVRKTNSEIPGCDYYDTVDISEGQRFPNGSFLFENLVIPSHLTGVYDFKLLANNSKENVASHMRGCVCKLRTCVRFCCGHYDILEENQCQNDTTQDELNQLDPYLNMTLNDGSVVKRHFKDKMIVQWDFPMPCDSMFYLDIRDKTDEYSLFENGTFLRHYDNATLNKRQYCLQHYLFEDKTDNSTFFRIAPHNCMTEELKQTRQKTQKTWQTVAMVISLICMILTIGVYLFVEELRNLLGKCFICYMVSLFIAYLFLLLNLWSLTKDFCITAGFIGYFFVMAAFLWLSVISLQIWITLNGLGLKYDFLSDNPFPSYNMFAWGMSIVLTGVTYLVDKFADHENWTPQMGAKEECWIYTKDWSAMIYFYGPILLLIIFNITMFILTARSIIIVKRTINNFTNKQERTKKLKSDTESYSYFLRLFIIMGLPWSLEIISYLVQSEDRWAEVFKVADYFNWSQGTIVFIVFILKRKTLKLIMKRTLKKSRLRSNNMKSTRGSAGGYVSKAPNTTLYSTSV
uniref:G-protein coupled receptor Mth-like n=1 Tax=Drosophila rhopaloa TaxID=1041015 RepID=A0A6P4FPK1_DRORH